MREAAGIAYDNYDLVVECGERRERTRVYSIVRFSVAPDFKFVPSAKYTDVGQVPAGWANEPPGDYVPVEARHPIDVDELRAEAGAPLEARTMPSEQKMDREAVAVLDLIGSD